MEPRQKAVQPDSKAGSSPFVMEFGGSAAVSGMHNCNWFLIMNRALSPYGANLDLLVDLMKRPHALQT